MKIEIASKYVRCLKRYKFITIIVWTVVTVVGLFLLPVFINSTSSEFNLPHDTPAYIANKVFEEEFPILSEKTTFAIVIQSENGSSVITQSIRNFIYQFNNSLYHSSIGSYIVQINSYFFYVDVGLPEAALGYISENYDTTIISIELSISSEALLEQALSVLRSTIKQLSVSGYKIVLTGDEALFDDMKRGTERDLIIMDSIVLPLALLVLAWVLRSFRLMLMPILSVFVSISVSFAIMVPIAKTMPVFSFVPSVMMALTIAFSIDYSLFLLSRYKEEIQKGKDVDTAIFLMLKHAGHTISVSGITLIVSFIGLTFFPLGLLATIGIGASVSVLVTLIVNLTLIPAILYIFPQFFSKFLQVKIPYRKNRKKLKKAKEDIWIQTGRDATKYAIPIILIVLVITIPISVQTMELEATLDYSHILPRHADSMAAYKIIKDSFSPGMLGPMYIIIVTNETNGVLTQSYFNVSATLVEYLTSHTAISLSSFIGISYAQGTKIDFVQALFLLSPESPIYNTTEARMYREMFNRYTNFDNSSTIIEVQPNFDPFGAYVETWIKEARKILDYFSNTTTYTFYLAGGSTDVVDAVDLAYDIFPTMIGVVLAVIYVVIAIMFQSLLVPLRLIFTVVLTISWIYGLAALIFDVGILDFISPPLRDVSSLYWATPIMSFSILIGLGLDYDIFLVSRISEFRDYGFTEKDSIIKGLSKTGRIITMAGIIMAIAFSGLMLSGSMVMNEFGFVLCAAVLLDTFLIRTILVPAIMSIAEKFNWWPSKKPTPDKKFEDEI